MDNHITNILPNDMGEGDLKSAGSHAYAEFKRRRDLPVRTDREREWKEVDRQIAMKAKEIVQRDSRDQSRAWMPVMEMPYQAWALEVLAADVKRRIFPRGKHWYEVTARFDDALGERIKEASLHFGDESLVPTGRANQSTADMLLRIAVDHYHSLYDFRRRWSRVISEGLRYGTYAGRAALVKRDVMTHDYRGVIAQRTAVPMFIPMTIKNVYPDDQSQHLLQEGYDIRPSTIKHFWQLHSDMILASRANGQSGWFAETVANLKAPKGKKKSTDRHIELIEWEGDIVLPQPEGRDQRLPNCIMTVCITGDPTVVRLRKSEMDFHSYIHGTYQDEDVDSPYGSSPILKGRTLQEIGTESMSRMVQGAALKAEPPILYDSGDNRLVADGGPIIAPGQKTAVDNLENTRVIDIGDITPITNTAVIAKNLHEELTGANQSRRGGDQKSHTTARGADIQLYQGGGRTDDYSESVETDGLRNWLFMQHTMIRKATATEVPMLAKVDNLKGYFKITNKLLAEGADYHVVGADGEVTQREKQQSFLSIYKTLVETEQLRVQGGGKPTDWDAMNAEMFKRFGESDADRFFKEPTPQTGGAPAGPGLPGNPQPPGGPLG